MIPESLTFEPEMVSTFRDENEGLLGYFVIDTTIGGHCCGGLRLSPTLSIDELRGLARGMTLKFGFTGLPQGGAKAGLVAPGNLALEDKRRLLRRFGELLSPFLRSRSYFTGGDMNVGPADIEDMLQAIGMPSKARFRTRGHQSGFYTALSVMVAAQAAGSVIRQDWTKSTVAIEGFGAVGIPLARLMSQRLGAKIVAVSTIKGAIYNPNGLDVERLLELCDTHGDEAVTAYKEADHIKMDELILLDVDVLAPCARQYPVTGENAGKVAARLICPGANNPVAPEAETTLLKRGIWSIPYFVANYGGVLGNRLEAFGTDERFIESFFRQLNHGRTIDLMQTSQRTGEPMLPLAERQALTRFRAMQRAGAGKGWRTRLYRSAVRVYNTGLIPEALVRPLAPAYFRRTILDPVLRTARGVSDDTSMGSIHPVPDPKL